LFSCKSALGDWVLQKVLSNELDVHKMSVHSQIGFIKCLLR